MHIILLKGFSNTHECLPEILQVLLGAELGQAGRDHHREQRQEQVAMLAQDLECLLDTTGYSYVP